MFQFNQKYFYFTLILFLVEVCIAVFVKDIFIRPFVGDILVVILIYCYIRTFLNIKSFIAAISVFIFACIIEILQYFNFLNKLGLQNNKILAIALGSTFDWKDIIAYAMGTIIIICLENKIK
ncbi:hypothetical protein NIES2101_20240 [Calothrix sp. HK-06]|nr:hypothetical protein NIES2101_20240 [Calothrix sp. HK-06]